MERRNRNLVNKSLVGQTYDFYCRCYPKFYFVKEQKLHCFAMLTHKSIMLLLRRFSRVRLCVTP